MDLWVKFRAYVVSIAGVFASVLAIYAFGRAKGAQKEGDRRDAADRKQSRKVEDAADQARTSDIGDPAEFLRKRGRVRND